MTPLSLLFHLGVLLVKTDCPTSGEVTTVMNAFLSQAISKHDESESKIYEGDVLG